MAKDKTIENVTMKSIAISTLISFVICLACIYLIGGNNGVIISTFALAGIVFSTISLIGGLRLLYLHKRK